MPPQGFNETEIVHIRRLHPIRHRKLRAVQLQGRWLIEGLENSQT